MNGLDTINWIDTDYEDPKVGEVVLIYGGLAAPYAVDYRCA